jgi:hypothetical protein
MMDFSDRVLGRLRGHVFHVTSLQSFKQIEADGFIDTNEHGRYQTRFGFPSSYGRRMGYVCLFDLRDRSDDDIEFAHLCLPFTSPRQLGDLVAYLLLSSAAFPQLISEQAAINDVGAHASRDWVPRLECWFPGRVPLEFVSSVFSVDFDKETMLDLEVANHRLHSDNLSSTQAVDEPHVKRKNE